MSSEAFGDPETRRRILDTTWRLIEETASTPRLAEVARRSNVSRQSVYLHFGDRAGLLVALVEHIDTTLDKSRAVGWVLEASTGVEALERMVEALSEYTAGIHSVASVFEAEQHGDAAVSEAWRNRMNLRRAQTRRIVERIKEEGRLAEGWTVDTATDLCYVALMPGLWRELVKEMGWSPSGYAIGMKRLLVRSIVADSGGRQVRPD